MEILTTFFASTVVLIGLAMVMKPLRMLSHLSGAKMQDWMPSKFERRPMECLMKEWLMPVLAIVVPGFLGAYGGHDLVWIVALVASSWGLLMGLEYLEHHYQKVIFLGAAIGICSLVAHIQAPEHGDYDAKMSFFEDEHVRFDREQAAWMVEDQWNGDCKKLLQLSDAALQGNIPGGQASLQSLLTSCNHKGNVHARIDVPSKPSSIPAFMPIIADE